MVYRERIYEHYTTTMQNLSGNFDRTQARNWARPYAHYLRGWLPVDTRAAVLDAGCGGGQLLQFLVDRGYMCVEGVDLSPDQVARSRQVIPADRVHHEDVVTFLEGRKSCFDLVVGLDIVEHLYKDELVRFFDALRVALRPGGRIILQTPNAGSPWGCEPRYGDLTHEVGFSVTSLRRLLLLCGFEGVEAREAGPVVHGLKSAVRACLWRVIRSGLVAWNYIEIGCRGDGVFTRVMLVSARKPSDTP